MIIICGLNYPSKRYAAVSLMEFRVSEIFGDPGIQSRNGVMMVELIASDIYKALKELGKLPKTLKLERITVKTDSVTGKQRKETISTDHAMVCVQCEGHTATVDFDKLKKFAKKLGNEPLSIIIDSYRALLLNYGNGEFVLCNSEVTPAASIDLDSMVVCS